MGKKTATSRPKVKRARDVPMGHGVFATGLTRDGGARRGIELRNLVWLENVLGRPLLIAFIRSFNAAERITALVHLYNLNGEHVAEGRLARARNGRLLTLLILSTLYEALDTVRGLRQGGVERLVGTSCVAWQRLEEIRVRWAKDPTLGIVRNKLGHHLGDVPDIERGLGAFAQGRRLVLFQTEGTGAVADSAFPIALDVLCRGLALDWTKVSASIEAGIRDQRVFAHGVQMVFSAALQRHGVRFSEDGATLDPAEAWPEDRPRKARSGRPTG